VWSRAELRVEGLYRGGFAAAGVAEFEGRLRGVRRDGGNFTRGEFKVCKPLVMRWGVCRMCMKIKTPIEG